MSRTLVFMFCVFLAKMSIADDPGIQVDQHSPLTTLERSIRQAGVRRYTFGSKSGHDMMLIKTSGSEAHSFPQRMSLMFSFPPNGVAPFRITYIEIEAHQDNNQGNAHIVSGGIGQRSVQILIEGENTQRLSYTATVYGAAGRAKPTILAGLAILLLVFRNVFNKM